MDNAFFSAMEIDAIGEIMNISLGSSATAVSNMLDHRVDITTPTVSVVKTADFSLGALNPALGVEITYVSGLGGGNIMLLKRDDIKMIVDILMGGEMSDEEFELNELTISAVCEVMNQMMGAAATALSDFLGFSVNISTPQPFELTDIEAFRQEHFPPGEDTIVVVRFSLKIEDALESEFMNVMSVNLAKEMLAGLGLGDLGGEAAPIQPDPQPTPGDAPGPSSGGGVMSQEEIERLLQGGGSQPAASGPPGSSSGGGVMSQEEIERLLQGDAFPQGGADNGGGQAAAAPEGQPQQPPVSGGPMPGGYPQPPQPGAVPFGDGQMGYPPPPYLYPYPYPYPYPYGGTQSEPKRIDAQPLSMPELDAARELGQEQAQNLELIMEVPLQVTVEIGRTQRKVQEILEFSKGSLVVLNKLAGDQVDLFVNGKCIARGDVVVVDDNFGVRITEIVQKPSLEKQLQK